MEGPTEEYVEQVAKAPSRGHGVQHGVERVHASRSGGADCSAIGEVVVQEAVAEPSRATSDQTNTTEYKAYLNTLAEQAGLAS